MSCTTHHICDCLRERTEKLEVLYLAATDLVRWDRFECIDENRDYRPWVKRLMDAIQTVDPNWNPLDEEPDLGDIPRMQCRDMEVEGE